jgi:hypothetical protein
MGGRRRYLHEKSCWAQDLCLQVESQWSLIVNPDESARAVNSGSEGDGEED